MAAEAIAGIESVVGTPRVDAMIAIQRRSLLLDRGQPTRPADEAIARVAARIQASPELADEPSLKRFARLAGSLLEGDGGRQAEIWEQMTALVPTLRHEAAAPFGARRLERFDRAVELFRDGKIRFAEIAEHAGLDPELAQRLADVGADAADRAAERAPNGPARAVPGEEGWELRALRGTLSAEEAQRLADLDPSAEERIREQHRRQLADGGMKALAAVWFALALKKAAQQTEMSLGVTGTRVDQLAETNRALANVEDAMRSAGWKPPTQADLAASLPREAAQQDEDPLENRSRGRGGYER